MYLSSLYKPGLDSIYITFILRYVESITCFISAFYMLFFPVEFAKNVNPHFDEASLKNNQEFMQILSFICGLFGNATLGYGLMKLYMLQPNKGHPFYLGKLLFCKVELVTKIISPCYIVRNLWINLNNPSFSMMDNVVELIFIGFCSLQLTCMTLSLYYEGKSSSPKPNKKSMPDSSD